MVKETAALGSAYILTVIFVPAGVNSMNVLETSDSWPEMIDSKMEHRNRPKS